MSAAPTLTRPQQPERGRRYSEAEYLTFDAQAEGRWEFLDGRIMPVGRPDLINQLDPTFRAGASPAHYSIASNMLRLLFGRLKKGCQPFASDARVHIPLTGGYLYPDVVVVCGKLEFADPEASLPALTNPVVLVEILSESTAEHDRVGKFMRYRSIETLQHYLLVDSRKKLVELFTRAGENWLYTAYSSDTDLIDLSALGCSLTLSEIYGGLNLPASDEGLSDQGG